MSAALLGKALSAPLPPDQKLVLLALANCANDDGLAWPTLATLERMTGYSADEVRVALRALHAAELISINPNGPPAVGNPNRLLVKGSAIDRLSNRRARS